MTDYLSPKETAIWVALNRVHRQCHAEINAALKKEGLPSIKWYDVLWGIERGGGSVRPYELEEQLIFEQSNLSHLIRRIASKGLIDIEQCDQDKRGKVLRITAEGRSVRALMWDIWGPLIHNQMSKLETMPEVVKLLEVWRQH